VTTCSIRCPACFTFYPYCRVSITFLPYLNDRLRVLPKLGPRASMRRVSSDTNNVINSATHCSRARSNSTCAGCLSFEPWATKHIRAGLFEAEAVITGSSGSLPPALNSPPVRPPTRFPVLFQTPVSQVKAIPRAITIPRSTRRFGCPSIRPSPSDVVAWCQSAK
jgi:hypothetical protein